MKQVFLLLVVTLVGVSLLPIEHSTTPPLANPAFQRLWTQQSALGGDGINLWGGEPLLWRVESYLDAPDSRRIVQYFDRGRMELTLARQSSSQAIVTQGLLAQEMTTGEVQLGDAFTEPKPPPATSIDSGATDDRIPTYASLSNVVMQRAANLVGKGVMPVPWIDSRGVPTAGGPVVPLLAATYVPETGHNLPDVTVALFNRDPFGPETWVQALGYPISEPYWTIYRRQGVALPSLIQVFQRRILVYTPSLPNDEQFTVANSGRHYYRWRYGIDPPLRWPNPQAGTPDLNITVPPGFEAGVYAQNIGTPVGLTIGPAGDLWVVTQEGQVLRVIADAPDGTAGQITVVAENLANPRGIAIQGASVYVTVDDGVIVFADTGTDAVIENPSHVTQSIEPAPGRRGAPAVDREGNIYVTGVNVANGQDRLLERISPGGQVTILPGRFNNPGPLMVEGQQLYVVDRSADGESLLVRIPLLGIQPGGPGDGEVGAPQLAAKFSVGTTVTSVLRFGSGLWSQTSPPIPQDTLFATIIHDDAGSVVRAVPRTDGGPPELVEFATGFVRPVAQAVGLDGSLYVADAGRGQVYKIIYPADR